MMIQFFILLLKQTTTNNGKNDNNKNFVADNPRRKIIVHSLHTFVLIQTLRTCASTRFFVVGGCLLLCGVTKKIFFYPSKNHQTHNNIDTRRRKQKIMLSPESPIDCSKLDKSHI